MLGIYGKSRFEREEYHIGATAGGAYAFNDKLSAALAVRYINIQATTNMTQVPYGSIFTNDVNATPYQVPTSISTSLRGNGVGIIVGFDIKPADFVNIGTRLEYYLPMILASIRTIHTNPVPPRRGSSTCSATASGPLLSMTVSIRTAWAIS